MRPSQGSKISDGRTRRSTLGPYFGAFLGLGFALSFFGPALPTLRDQTGTSVGEIGVVFSAQSIGGLLGSLVAGRLYRRVGGPHLIALAVLALVTGLAAIPLAGHLAVLVGLGFLLGFGAGSMDVGANTLTPTLVAPDRVISSINALHMCFAIGALATPLFVWGSLQLTDGLGLVCVSVAGAFGALGLAVWRRDGAHGVDAARVQHEERGTHPAAWRLALVGSFFLLYVGLEVCVAGWIATYAGELDLGDDWGTVFTACFWGGFLVGRVLMAWRGDRFATGAVLWWSVGMSSALALVLALVGARAVAISVVMVAFGIVIAPQFATMFAHLHRVYPLTGPISAWCIGGSAVGGLLLPVMIGVLFDEVGAAALPWTVFGASVASALVLAAIDRWALVPAPAAAVA